jgi:hypothetical protein
MYFSQNYSADGLSTSVSLDLNATNTQFNANGIYQINYWIGVSAPAAASAIQLTVHCVDNNGNDSASASTPTSSDLCDASSVLTGSA